MRKLTLIVLLFGISQWSVAGWFSDDEAHKKIVGIQQQIQTLDARLDSTKTQVDVFDQHIAALEKYLITLETRVIAAENQMQAQTKGILNLVLQIDMLKAELTKLQGQNEVYAHDIETTQKRQRDLYADVDGRLRKLEHSETQAINEAQAKIEAQQAKASAVQDQNLTVRECASQGGHKYIAVKSQYQSKANIQKPQLPRQPTQQQPVQSQLLPVNKAAPINPRWQNIRPAIPPNWQKNFFPPDKSLPVSGSELIRKRFASSLPQRTGLFV